MKKVNKDLSEWTLPAGYILRIQLVTQVRLKADFHSAENIARSTFSAHFLLNCSNQIQISEHISKESEREKSIARYFPLNGNPPLKADFHSAENVARSTFSARFLLKCVH